MWKTGAGGWAAIIIGPDGEETVLQGKAINTTNNRMELLAIVEALKIIPNDAHVMIYSDSEYALFLMAGIYHPRHGRNIDLVQDLRTLFNSHPNAAYKHVRGHSGDVYNERADKLALANTRSVNLPASFG